MSENSQPSRDADLTGPLRKVFGFGAFRRDQEPLVRAVLAGRDAFAVMPTGGGKSLCYQLPAHLLSGTCVVISPLISLMKDQVDAAVANGLAAELLNSSITPAARSAVLGRLAGGELDLLYVAPERFALAGFQSALAAAKLCLFAVDEAHCISEWGHDFRPDYLSLSAIVERFSETPVAAFTATATERVQHDIIGRLGLRDPHVVRASFDRPNLFYQVLPKDNANRQILRFLRDRPGQAGIIYRTTRSSVEQTSGSLAAGGVRALPYHAGLDDEVRKANQDAFNRDEIDVIVATIAFGMGIDKSNIRFVVHADLPKNIESYYQETGRSGRDGEPAHCLLLFGPGDIPKIRYFIDQSEDEAQRTVATAKLNDMVQFATVNACRRRALLGYFGERLADDDCGGCDICTGQVDQVDAETEARILLSAVARTGQRFGAGQVVDVVTGANTQRVRDLGHDSLKTYGAGADKDKRFWRRVIDNLIAQECLVRTDDQYPVLHMTAKGRELMAKGGEFHILKHREPTKRRKARSADSIVVEDYDEALFGALRTLRKRLAGEQGVPPYIIFSDRTLREMAGAAPTDPHQLRGLHGVGEVKLKRYGEAFLEEIRRYGAS